MGYVVIGVAAAASTSISARARELAIDGAILQMIAHGFVTATLFFIAGFIKERAGTRDLGRLAGLMRPMPWYGSVVALAFFASLGLPGLAQFPAELQIFLGTFDVWPAIAVFAAFGIVITAALFLLALQRAFLGDTPEPLAQLPDLSRREIAAVAPLVALFVVLGVYPRLALDLIDSASWLLGG
jgi:NADH-quinone oxidoreductase subunit M